MIRKIFIFLLLNISFFTVKAQYQESDLFLMGGAKTLEFTTEFPDNLLSSRSVVVVSCPPEGSKPAKIKNWRHFSEQVHKAFHSSGVDAVAYFNLKDLISGPETTKAFAEDFKARQFNVLIFLELKEKDGTAYFNMFMTKINEDGSLLKDHQSVFASSGQDLEAMLKSLGNKLIRDNLKKTNYLINTVPEYFSETQIIRNRRYENYAPDLKVDKLAVPVFHHFPVIHTDSLNNKEEALKEVMKNIFQDYPLKHEYVELAKGEEAFRRSGNLFVLYYIHSSAGSIRQILGFNDAEDVEEIKVKVREGESIKEKPVSLNKTVYKFYLKQLQSKDVFVGSLWDADEDWETALKNFIYNLKKELKVN